MFKDHLIGVRGVDFSSLMCHCSSQIKPLGPKSHQHQISPNNVNTLLKEKFMRITKMITSAKIALMFEQVLLTNSVRKCIEISLENLYVDRGV